MALSSKVPRRPTSSPGIPRKKAAQWDDETKEAVQLQFQLSELQAELAEKGERIQNQEADLRRLRQQLAQTTEQIEAALREQLLETMREEKAQEMKAFLASRGEEMSELRATLREETKKEVEREMREEIASVQRQMQTTLAEEREKMRTEIYAEIFDKLKRHQAHERATHERYLAERMDRMGRATIPTPDWLNRSQPPLRLHKSLHDMWDTGPSSAESATPNAPTHKALKGLDWDTL